MQHHVHEVLEVLSWAYPAKPENAPLGSGETSYKYDRKEPTYPQLMMEQIQDNIRLLYSDMPIKNFPIVLEDYYLLFPGLANPSYHDIIFGFAKERFSAYEKRMAKAKKSERSLTVKGGMFQSSNSYILTRMMHYKHVHYR